MTEAHKDAVDALLRAMDERLATAPLIDRRGVRKPSLIEASRARGPVTGDFAYWSSSPGETDSSAGNPSR